MLTLHDALPITQEFPVGNQTELNITLEPDMQALGEFVVVGYGTQKKENLTGATSSVSFGNLENRPIGNTASLLQGQLPGVTVGARSEEHTSELQSLMRISYAVFCFKKQT